MKLHKYDYLEDAYQVALRFEKGLKGEKNYKSKSTSSSWSKRKETWKSSSHWDKPKETKQDFKNQVEKFKPKVEAKEGGNNAQYKSLTNIRFHKCHVLGHYMRDCPNHRVIIEMEGGRYQTGDSDHSEDVEEESESDDGECEEEDMKRYLVVRRLMSALAKEELDQMENLFHAKCKIMGDVCSMIIDNGSCAKVTSAYLVEKLNLPTMKRPTPYRLQWLNECGELKVTKLVLIKFKIEKYHDEVWCDVVPMQACYLLLGWPWQYDREAKYYGKTNKYSLVKDGHKFTLLPMTPF
ncbi:uncharacterized protein [Nicotiana tomentosiformis]|uniref:uncharacterized protein n=1 Tax=Nicotiana tomentosiformis TaxID=4098 RepID=UPI00388C5301